MATVSTAVYCDQVTGNAEDSKNNFQNSRSEKEHKFNEKSNNEEKWPVMLVSKESQQSIKNQDVTRIERTNLLGICKLVTKELIESSLKYGRMLDSDHIPLRHFFILLEHIFRHGLKSKKGILGPKKELWNVLERIEKFMTEAHDITSSVRALPNIKTQLGRCRAWLMLALMQKQLADYFRCLVDRKDILSEYYEPYALMVCEEAVIIGGLLVGLNVIDCNLCVKEEDLDNQQGVIDFTSYMKDASHAEIQQEGIDPTNMTAVLDQKNYLEELNRHLTATVTNLQAKVENLQTTNALMKEDLAIVKNEVLALQEENEKMKSEQNCMKQDHNRKLEDAKADMNAERETYQTSRAGLDTMYHELKQKLLEETRNRLDVEKELELQISMKAEMEMATKLLEKDIHEKQDTIISIRQQLDDIKLINVEMYKKLQACEASLKYKTDLVVKLEQKMAQMTDIIKQLEEKCNCLEKEYHSSEETARKLGQHLADREQKRSALETDLKIEHEWRTSLQDSIVQEKERVSELLLEIQQLKAFTNDYETLRNQRDKLQRTCTEHEETLRDLAAHLGESKLKMEDMKEATSFLKEAVWTSDKDAPSCKQCSKEFSIARRKHHCRHCGDIFCHSCSDNTMPLASSAKPVRVCDNCHTLLLQRYSTK